MLHSMHFKSLLQITLLLIISTTVKAIGPPQFTPLACYTQQALTINANRIVTSYSPLQNFFFNASLIQCMNTTFTCPGVGSNADFCTANSQTTGPITLYSVMSISTCASLGSVNGTAGSVNCCVGSGLIGCNAPMGVNITNNLYYNAMQPLPQSSANNMKRGMIVIGVCLIGLLII